MHPPAPRHRNLRQTSRALGRPVSVPCSRAFTRPHPPRSPRIPGRLRLRHPFAAARAPTPGPPPATFLDILRQPDLAAAYPTPSQRLPLTRTTSTWSSRDIRLTCAEDSRSLRLTLTAPETPLERLHLRWCLPVSPTLRILGDAWERSYGDLGWRPIVPEQALPWFFLTFDGSATHGYGVQTAPAALVFWQCDPEGISLWLDLRNGGEAVALGPRTFPLATVLTRQGNAEESSFAAAQAFCRDLCPHPLLPSEPVFGSNDWYYAYGKSSAADILRDAALMAELAPNPGPRPFTVIDEGWEHNPRFPSMPALAADIRRLGVRPGLWIRPLRAPASASPTLLLPAQRFAIHPDRAPENRAFDPTIPEAREQVLATIRAAVAWNFELIKHDFTTFDLLGQWGNEMDASPTLPGWHFHDRSRTNAEIIRDLYAGIRHAAGPRTLIVGCNVVGHLSAGLFELHRTGDDVSGKLWERTRRMGVNTLAFRLPQHNTFHRMDPDCIPITEAIPWHLTRLWLNAVAEAGAALIVSPAPGTLTPEKMTALRTAFATAARQPAANPPPANPPPANPSTANPPTAQPTDWLTARTPELWSSPNPTQPPIRYPWLEPEGASPFEI